MGRETRIIRELRAAGFTVLSRKQWGSRRRPLYQWRRIHKHFPGRAKCFFAHVTVTNPTDSFAADVRLLERIGYDRFRTGISYNYAVDQRTGAIAIGMPHDAAGAHTLNDKGIDGFPDNLNYFGHGIAWIGNIGDRPSQDCKDAFSAIIAAEKKQNAAREDARIYPHSKFAWKECPLTVMTNALPAIFDKSETILEGDWFDMATKKELREVVDAALRAERPKIVQQVKHELLHETDVFPHEKDKNVTVNSVLARTWGHLTSKG
jgi:N-acetylmuramoyl-L-alanine amidase